MIRGVGLDIVDVASFRRSMERFGSRFTSRIFSDTERKHCEAKPDPATHLAARFAAREAFIKAAGGVPGLKASDIEVVSDGAGRPGLVLRGAALDAARGGKVHISLTHEKNIAAAFAVIEH